MKRLTRRNFIGAGVALGVLAISRRFRVFRVAQRDPDRAWEVCLPPADSAPVGVAYLQARPQEASIGRLILDLFPGRRAQSTDPRTARALRRELRRRIRRDFDTGHVVSVDGWVLSRTEARLCALTALVAR